ncbi:oligopeptide/dipeptide ABC transporter, ATP-binding protein, C-terminal domain-containing protein [Pseudooceanicola antarcticus]|uniref:ABC transporter ATP-binding protein n=1 Tax=Pseudooceanicola antarcticus TaxID=1247613 RepID=A0A285J789_9RHOB|nr:ABC transporter ATP-binding protein [Pseudooceanicola antarcticus]PJE27012.1 ABC transporter ATP-binding protein [Pseudooceanicola antarcticus]SNY56144.1 oligopeptide/dipeptide ABC transporter, ATP-binding protein, C-terminal domain-containing protein [Pseudooceanicola antarcticus]
MSDHLLEVRGLRTWFETPKGTVKAVDGVDLTLERGEILGLVGESGSGKSITGFSLLGLVDPPGRVVEGDIRFLGEDLRSASPRRLRDLRGNRIAMIFQDPMMTLNPVLRIGTQMIETVRAHAKVSKAEARAMARDALGQVGIPHPDERIDAYPHEFSGGMRQRVAIAIALLHKPDLIIADEPTTALDVTIQSQILSEVQTLTREMGMGLIWISHDLGVVGQLANKVAVMYAGRIVERGTVDEVLDAPRHPYTRGLIDSLPMENDRGQPLRQIPGNAPPPLGRPEGCPFRPRCARATEACLTEPAETEVQGRGWRCFHPLDERAMV